MRDLVHNNNRWHVGQTVRHQIVGSHQPIHGYMTASVFNVLLFAGSIHATPWHVRRLRILLSCNLRSQMVPRWFTRLRKIASGTAPGAETTMKCHCVSSKKWLGERCQPYRRAGTSLSPGGPLPCPSIAAHASTARRRARCSILGGGDTSWPRLGWGGAARRSPRRDLPCALAAEEDFDEGDALQREVADDIHPAEDEEDNDRDHGHRLARRPHVVHRGRVESQRGHEDVEHHCRVHAGLHLERPCEERVDKWRGDHLCDPNTESGRAGRALSAWPTGGRARRLRGGSLVEIRASDK